ncbi:hemerythrin domain-containing protein [Patescibacteria group bacterium]|nr:hemerythrin domain-containing protein [Patescibacteria group bacterium]
MNEGILDYMSKDHDRLDKIYQEFQKVREKDKEEARDLFHEFKTGLQRHIIWEEDILFPLFEEKTEAKENGPTEVMRQEHREIKEVLEKIHDEVRQGTGGQKLDKELYGILEEHNRKEEMILYPWIDRAISEKEAKEIFVKMKQIAPERYNHCC